MPHAVVAACSYKRQSCIREVGFHGTCMYRASASHQQTWTPEQTSDVMIQIASRTDLVSRPIAGGVTTHLHSLQWVAKEEQRSVCKRFGPLPLILQFTRATSVAAACKASVHQRISRTKTPWHHVCWLVYR